MFTKIGGAMREIEITLPKLPEFIKKLFTKPEIRKEVQELQYNLERYPEDWTCDSDRNVIYHTRTKIGLWVSNGWEYLDFWPEQDAFSKREQKYLWLHAQRIRDRTKIKAQAKESMSGNDFSKLMQQIKEFQRGAK